MKSSNISYLIILGLLFSSGINSLVLRYINERKVWKDAVAHCSLLNGSLLSITKDELYSLANCHFIDNVTFPIWTGYIESLSDWIETNYCYKSEDIDYKNNVTTDDAVSPYDCQQYCNGSNHFAQAQDQQEVCFCDVSVTSGADHKPFCDSSFQYRLYRVVQDSSITYSECNGVHCKCVYPECHGNNCNNDNDKLYASDCYECRDVSCQIDRFTEKSLTWFDAMSFCNKSKTMLRIPDILFKKDDYTWIGISRGDAYIHSMYTLVNSQNVKPTACFTISQNVIVRTSGCGSQRNFVCKIGVNDEKKPDDCDIVYKPQASEKSTVKSKLKRITCNQNTTTTGNNIHESTMYSATSILTTQHGPVVSFEEDKSSDMMTIIGAVIGAVLIIIIASILLIFTLRKRKGKLCRNSDNSVKMKRNQDSNDISSIKLNNMNINNKKSDCYSFAAFEKDDNSVPVIKQENNEKHNPMYEPSSLQEEIRTYGMGDKSTHPYEDNRSYETECGARYEQDYGDYNISNTNTSIPTQNLYDSSAGIYNHINHGSTQNRIEDTYDHFNGSEQDYDQIENKLQKANASSEYSYCS